MNTNLSGSMSWVMIEGRRFAEALEKQEMLGDC